MEFIKEKKYKHNHLAKLLNGENIKKERQKQDKFENICDKHIDGA